MARRSDSKRRIVEWGIICFVLVFLGLGWWLLLGTRRGDVPPAIDYPAIEVEGRVCIPYFLMIMDRSASMRETDRDPENYEKEALRQVLRMIYWSGRQLHEATGEHPRVRLLTFAESPESLPELDEWTILAAEEDVIRLDKLADAALTERNGQLTDINAAVEYAERAWRSIPRYLGEGGQARPTAMVAILFTDGDIHPNFLNRINHEKSGEWEAFGRKVALLADEALGKGKGEELLSNVKKNGSFNPLGWASGTTSRQRAAAFSTRFYQANAEYGIPAEIRTTHGDIETAKRRYFHARNTKQEQMREILLSPPPDHAAIRLNIVALLKGSSGAVAAADAYLRKWTDTLGFYYRIKDAADLGPVFVDILSEYLNSFSESFSGKGTRVFDPFSRDIAAAELTVMFPRKIPAEAQERFIRFFSPSGRAVEARLNEALEHSRSYYVTPEEYEDFHDAPGWRLQVSPVEVGGKMIEAASCFLVTFHDYALDVRPGVGPEDRLDLARYVVRLVSLTDRAVVPLDRFEEPLRIEAGVQGRSGPLPDVLFSETGARDGINADFVDWPEGQYTIMFRLSGGMLKGDSARLRGRSLAARIDIAGKMGAFDPDGKRIFHLRFDDLDRK